MGKPPLTEEIWHTHQSGYGMLYGVRGKIRCWGRKLRLVGVGCCRRIWHRLPDPRSRSAVEVAEAYADGLATDADLRTAFEAAAAAHQAAFRVKGKIGASAEWAAQFVADSKPFFAATRACNFAYVAAGDGHAGGPEHVAQADLVREVFGTLLFGEVAVDRTWLTADVVGLAQQIYCNRVFGLMPALGAALSDAGCTETSILEHCSTPNHVKGCFLVDMLLGKE